SIVVSAVTEVTKEQTTIGTSGATTPLEEASGEEPLDKNALPEVQASKDASPTAITAGETLPETTSTSRTISSSTPSSSAPTEAGTESVESSNLPKVEANIEASTIVPGSTFPVVVVMPESSVATLESDQSTTSPSKSPTTGSGEVSPTTVSGQEEVPESSTPHETTSEKPEGISGLPEEASGEEPLKNKKLPEVEANLDESSTTAKMVEGIVPVIIVGVPTGETTTTPRGEASTTSSMLSSSLTSVEGSSSTVSPSSVAVGTAGETTTQLEASGEEQAGSSKLPIVEANIDESASTVSSSTIHADGAQEVTGKGSSEIPKTSAEESTATTVSPDSESTGTAASTVSESTTVVSNQGGVTSSLGNEQATAEGKEFTTPSSQEIATSTTVEGSGELPSESRKLPKVEASNDENVSTLLATTEEVTEGPAVTDKGITPLMGFPHHLVGPNVTVSSRPESSVTESVASGESTSTSSSSTSSAENVEEIFVPTAESLSSTVSTVTSESSSPTPPSSTLSKEEAETTSMISQEGTSTTLGGDQTISPKEETATSSSKVDETTLAVEGSGEGAIESNKLPRIEASLDASTSAVSADKTTEGPAVTSDRGLTPLLVLPHHPLGSTTVSSQSSSTV
ncbi:unnamed protein product, partial [Strongylus vulgaris]